MKPIKNNPNKLSLAQNSQKINPTGKTKVKNLSSAKKFRLKLRRAKFQKQKQSKEDYFEHDNRDFTRSLSHERKKKAGRLYRKGRRAQMYIDAYLKSQHEKLLNRNGKIVSQDETQDSSNENDVSLKSIVHKANFRLSPAMTSQVTRPFDREQAVHNGRHFASNAGSVSTIKCCCHCACSEKRKKPRRKLSSPYFGDFNRTTSFPNGSCAREAAEVTRKIINKTTTTTHHETLLKADIDGIIDYRNPPLTLSTALKHRQMVPIFKKNYKLQDQRSIFGCELGDVRSVMRLVM